MKWLLLVVVALGLAAWTFSNATAPSSAQSNEAQSDARPYKVTIPGLSAKDPEPPTPTPAPTQAPPTNPNYPKPNNGPVMALYLGSAGIDGNWPIQQRDTEYRYGVETFQDPATPGGIAWYYLWGTPGRDRNSIFAGHVDYYDGSRTPFTYLTWASPGETLQVLMGDGTFYRYTVKSIETLVAANIDMNALVYPALPPGVERVTLMSCGGRFIPNPNGVGGEYESRVVLIAERVR